MNVKTFIKKYTMVIALVVVFIFFSWWTEKRLLYPQNLSNLLIQNAYVLVLACGMLMCILTGGNIDLSVGSTVCLIGAIAAKMLTQKSIDPIVVILPGFCLHYRYGAGILDRIYTYTAFYLYPCGNVRVQRNRTCDT